MGQANMRLENLESALVTRPFRAFIMRVDGDVVRVDHPEQVMLAPKSETVIYLDREEHIHIFDADAISKIRLIRHTPRKGPPTAGD